MRVMLLMLMLLEDSLFSSQVAESVLGWKSRRSLGEMCRDMWNWQTKNPQGFSAKQ